MITEGLLIYLSAEDVGALARDLAAVPSVRTWVLDLVSPKLLKMLSRRVGGALERAGARPQFAPEEGPAFFGRHGWHAVEVGSVMKTAARLRRLSPLMRLAALLPEPPGRPASGVCLMARA